MYIDLVVGYNLIMQYIIQLNFANPKPTVRYLGEQNNCNSPLKKAKRFSMEEAQNVVASPVLRNFDPQIIPV